jgi:hypothetical protein
MGERKRKRQGRRDGEDVGGERGRTRKAFFLYLRFVFAYDSSHSFQWDGKARQRWPSAARAQERTFTTTDRPSERPSELAYLLALLYTGSHYLLHYHKEPLLIGCKPEDIEKLHLLPSDLTQISIRLAPASPSTITMSAPEPTTTAAAEATPSTSTSSSAMALDPTAPAFVPTSPIASTSSSAVPAASSSEPSLIKPEEAQLAADCLAQGTYGPHPHATKAAESQAKPPPSSLLAPFLPPVEFYFNDANLPYDKFLWTTTQRDPQGKGWVPIALVSSFKRMAVFNAMGLPWVAEALRKSDGLLAVDEQGKMVRRIPELKPPVDAFGRSVYAVRPVLALPFPSSRGAGESEGGNKEADFSRSLAILTGAVLCVGAFV